MGNVVCFCIFRRHLVVQPQFGAINNVPSPTECYPLEGAAPLSSFILALPTDSVVDPRPAESATGLRTETNAAKDLHSTVMRLGGRLGLTGSTVVKLPRFAGRNRFRFRPRLDSPNSRSLALHCSPHNGRLLAVDFSILNAVRHKHYHHLPYPAEVDNCAIEDLDST